MKEQLELFPTEVGYELFPNYDASFDKLIENVVGWAADKDILKKENAPKQMLKVLEEVGETAGALLKSKDAEIKDGIGDAFVTLIILAKQLGLTPNECLEAAWNEIKDRTGKTVNGVFVKN
jgi:NTP pyrophosphatase (non-canonical NTP hydrolase)